jgi:hypothetical protein
VKYIFEFFGGRQETEEGLRAGKQAMAEWYSRLGGALIDGGGPITDAARSVSPDGATTNQAIGEKPHGYCIVKAESIAAAAEIAKGCPLLKTGRSISVLEVYGG